jgi:UDP-N-acetylglucosamine--N-acetylmuramyl-(pentapeptide) pyrophosphoryl-undecaprenol N-acetylglucosamine transferase
VLTGGGTGGHIYPALSVARCLEGDEILYVGTADGPEAAIVPQAGVPFRSVPSRKLSRKPTPGTLIALGVSGWGVLRAAGLLLSWRPDVVLGTGGYASAGIMFAAALLRIPTVVHEANVVPGRVNRLLAKLCTRVALTYEASAKYFPAGKSVVTGLPVRPDLITASPEKARTQYGLSPDRPVLVVSGGCGGAQTLNRAVLQALPELGKLGVQVVHQTGRKQYDEVMQEVGTAPDFYHPLAYVDDMPALLAAATLILCRGGSSSLAEVTAAGLPAIVVPYPFAVADHQTHNARALAEQGAAVMVADAEMDGARLVREVSTVLQEPRCLDKMRSASRSQGRPEAAQRVAELLRSIARKPRTRESAAAIA